MDDEKTQSVVRQDLVATIVSSYVKHNKVSADALPTVIASVQQAFSGLEKPASPAEPLVPAVPVRQSVRPDYVVCLECGFRGQTLRRHLGIQHWSRACGVLRSLEIAARSPDYCAGLFGAALSDGEGNWAQYRQRASAASPRL
jgi:hypothetical protein